MASDSPNWRDRARRLAAELQENGYIRTAPWRIAVERTPRHVFVPRFYADDDSGGHVLVDGADPEQRQRWLDAVYSDDTLVTQLGAAPVPAELGGGEQVRPTSSSTAPSLMLRMLEDLEVTDASRVLEIGAGTGYNAALLCARLGDRQVASVDIHPELVATACNRLAGLGHRPALRTGDGADGFADTAPFDRVIATAAVSTIPAAWVEQAAPGAVILTDLRGDIAGGMVKLRKDQDAAHGVFLDYPGWFMWLRSRAEYPLRAGELPYLEVDKRNASTRSTTVDPRLLGDEAFAFLAQLHLPGARLYPPCTDDDDYLLVGSSDDSWAEVSRRSAHLSVQYGGPRDLWRTIEAAYDLWTRAGRPSRGRYGVTATPEAAYVWLDDPTDGPSWELPR